MLYELLTGKAPFAEQEGPMALMYQHLHAVPPPLPESIPASLRLQVERLLAKNPHERPANALLVRQALTAAIDGEETRLTMRLTPGREAAPALTAGGPGGEPAFVEAESETMMPGTLLQPGTVVQQQAVATRSRPRRVAMWRYGAVVGSVLVVGLLLGGLWVRFQPPAEEAQPPQQEAKVEPPQALTPSPGGHREDGSTGSNIRKVDFRNFSYPLSPSDVKILEMQMVRVRDGKYDNGKQDDDWQAFEVGKIVYGDLTGDGQEEAVILMTNEFVGINPANSISRGFYAYTMKNGNPSILATPDRINYSRDYRPYENPNDQCDGWVWDATPEAISGLLLTLELTVGGRHCVDDSGYRVAMRYRLSGSHLVLAGNPVKTKVSAQDTRDSSSYSSSSTPPATVSAPPRMVSVPAGAFFMGCNAAVDKQCDDDEKPGRTVSVDAFAIDTYEVTVANYQKCVGAGKCTAPNTGGFCNWDQAGREQHPINCVDWNQADAYCRWAGKRLPTEAEREKAARGTDKRVYPWGNDWDARKANAGGMNGTVAVGSFAAGISPYGAHDMSGNVWEWTADWYDSDYYQQNGSVKNPKGPANGTFRAVRGGSFAGPPQVARASLRHGSVPGSRSEFVGLRCVQ